MAALDNNGVVLTEAEQQIRQRQLEVINKLKEEVGIHDGASFCEIVEGASSLIRKLSQTKATSDEANKTGDDGPVQYLN